MKSIAKLLSIVAATVFIGACAHGPHHGGPGGAGCPKKQDCRPCPSCPKGGAAAATAQQPAATIYWCACGPRMIEEGVRGELKSCVPPVTAPAWTSFFTGKNPGRHGVFDFVQQDRDSYEFHPVNSRSYHGKSLWEVIGDQGRNVAVLNVPMTHPAYPVKGALVSDFLLATTKGERSHPPELLGELEKKFGPYPTETVPPYFAGRDSEEDICRFLQEYQQAMQYKLRVAQHFLEKDKPDFLMLHLFGNDQICHWLWHLMDDKHASLIMSVR